MRILLVLVLSLATLVNLTPSRSVANQPTIPSPTDVFGFTPGDDRKLPSWSQVVDYFQQLDRASDRLNFQELGKSTMGKPFVMATISSPANLARLEEYKTIQEQLADPRKLGPAATRDRKSAELIERGKTIILITCGIHSTEVGSYLSSTLIAHRLASSDEPDIQRILENTVILLVPSLNPDGVDIVKNWYDKTLGTSYEGTDPPELYHKYIGHDNNRDWYAFTQVETQLTVDKIHNVWHPQIVHDIHQQGAFGSRLFVPPYMPPVEPNVPKQIVEGYTELGNYLAKEMRGAGFKGITTNSTYDAWSPSRAYSHYHGGVRILSETASAKIASPINVKFDDLTSREGYDPKKESANFGPLWHGGEWHLRDITNTMTTCAFFLLQHAADNREAWLKRFYTIGREAVRPRRAGELWGYAINDRDEAGYRESRLTNILSQAQVEVEWSSQGRPFVQMAQPYAAFATAVLEERRYPDLRDSTGHPIAPYDATAHTLPLLMNLSIRKIRAPFRLEKARNVFGRDRHLTFGEILQMASRAPSIGLYRSTVPSYDEGWTRWVLENESIRFVSVTDSQLKATDLSNGPNVIVIPDQPTRTILNGYRAGTMPPELTGGLGQEGTNKLRQFVEAGGTLIFLNRASEFAITQFKLPIRNVVSSLPQTQFYVPGSILRLELDTSHPIAHGMPKESIAWVEDSPVFEVVSDPNSSVPKENVKIIGWYPRHKDPLLSGWLLGGERIKGKAALVEVTMGKGRGILFGFRPQYRAQSLATYPLFFNSLLPRN